MKEFDWWSQVTDTLEITMRDNYHCICKEYFDDSMELWRFNIINDEIIIQMIFENEMFLLFNLNYLNEK